MDKGGVKMEKRKYETPGISVVLLNTEDVLTTSGEPQNEDWGVWLSQWD